MLKRSCPCNSTSFVIGNGKTSASSPFTLPVFSRSSLAVSLWKTVSGGRGRAACPSAKKSLAASGLTFGWSAIFCAQPAASTTAHAASHTRQPLALHIVHLARLQASQEFPGFLHVKLWVGGLNAQEKTILRGTDKVVDIEERMVRHGQAVQQQQPDDPGQRRAQDGRLEGDRDEGRPAIERLAADVERNGNHRHVVLQAKARQPADEPAEQDDPGKRRPGQAERLRQPIHREGRISVDTLVASRAAALRGPDKLIGVVELGQQTVKRGSRRRGTRHALCSFCVSVSNLRISKIEMAGRSRMNTNSMAANRPIVPNSVAMSQLVGR